MNWNDHSKLKGRHALLGPSGYSWLNYSDDDPESLFSRYISQYATEIGTLVHSYAEDRIRFRLKLNKSEKNSVLLHLLSNGIPRSVIDIDYIFPTLMAYVNDSIVCRMDPEVLLYHSDNCFGTTDAISYRNGILRINDLKTGKTTAKIEQLEIYAALFCLEYHVRPIDISMELTLYQDGEGEMYSPEPAEIEEIMTKIVKFDKIINEWKERDAE